MLQFTCLALPVEVLSSRGLLSETMPSVVKASAQEPPKALREVDRLRENLENDSQHRQ